MKKLTTLQLLEGLSGKKIEVMLHEKGTQFELKSGQYVAVIRETKTKIVISTRKTSKDLEVYYIRAFAKHLGITSKELRDRLTIKPSPSTGTVPVKVRIVKPVKNTTKSSKKTTKRTADTSSAPSKVETAKPFVLQVDRADKYYKNRPAYKVPTDKVSGKKVHHWSHVVKTFRGKINQYEVVTAKAVKTVLKDIFSKYVCDEELIASKCWIYIERKFGITEPRK